MTMFSLNPLIHSVDTTPKSFIVLSIWFSIDAFLTVPIKVNEKYQYLLAQVVRGPAQDLSMVFSV